MSFILVVNDACLIKIIVKDVESLVNKTVIDVENVDEKSSVSAWTAAQLDVIVYQSKETKMSWLSVLD